VYEERLDLSSEPTLIWSRYKTASGKWGIGVHLPITTAGTGSADTFYLPSPPSRRQSNSITLGGVFGPSGTLVELRSWLGTAGMVDASTGRDGALAYFSARRADKAP
jgi:hypothetical protein